jgi:general secretion pathway protein L
MPQRVIALDITDADIKATVVETSFRDYRVTGFYRDALSVANGTREEQIRRFLERHSLAGDTILTGLPGDSVTWRTLFLPFRDRKRLLQTIPFELESQVPFGLDEVVVDHYVVNRDRAGTTVLAALVLKRDLERHLEVLNAAGVDPKVVDVGPLASLNTLSLVPDLPPTFAFLDCGEHSCTAALYRNKQLVGLRMLSVPRAPGHNNGAGPDEEHGSTNGSGNAGNGVALLTTPAIGGASPSMLAEIQWTLLALNGAPLDDELPCYLAGDPAALGVDARELETKLGVKTHALDRMPLRGLDPGAGREATGFSTSLGLALREVAPGEALGVNFRRGEFTYHAAEEEIRRRWRATATLLVVVVALGLGWLYMDYWNKASQVAAIDRQIRRVVESTLPDVPISAPRTQLEEEIEGLRQRLGLLHGAVPASGATGVDILRAISAAIPTKIRVDSDDYTLEPDSVRMRANTDTFESVDSIKQALINGNYFSDVEVKDVKAAKDGAGVDFRLRLGLAKDIAAKGERP